MKPSELMSELPKLKSDNPIALVDDVTNEHLYDVIVGSGYIHISGDDNWFEIYVDFDCKTLLKLLVKHIVCKIKLELFELTHRMRAKK